MSEPVGNKRPPVHSRFKKGQSGNPRGRPKNTLNFTTDLLSELAEAIAVTGRDGARYKITKQRAFVKATVAAAIRGDGRATAVLINMILKLAPPPPPAAEETPLSENDQAILDAFLKTTFI